MANNSMNLNLPVPETTQGPEWATQLNTQLETNVAEHDHTSGKGVPISQAGIQITDQLTMGNNDLTNTRTVRFENQPAALAGVNDVGCLYEAGGNLYYNDNNGTQIPITAGGAIAVGSVGGITGLGGTSATAGFNVDTFTFKSDATHYAIMDHGPVTVRSNNDVNPAYGITIKSVNSLAASYNLTLPAATPAATAFMTLDNGGAIGTSISTNQGILNSMLAPNAVSEVKIASNVVTPTKMGASNFASSNILTAVQPAAGAFNDVSNANVSLVWTADRPIIVAFQPHPNATSAASAYNAIAGASNVRWQARLRYNSTSSPSNKFVGWASYEIVASGNNAQSPLFYQYIFKPTSAVIGDTVNIFLQGTYSALVNGSPFRFDYMQLVAYVL